MKFTPGPIVSTLSGKQGGVVASRNGSGSYFRRLAIPVTVTSDAAVAAKAAFANASQHWRTLTDAQQAAWKSFARENPVTDALGQQVTLSGIAICTSLNSRLSQMSIAHIDVPPVTAPPVALATASLTPDIGAGDFDFDYTVSAVPASTQYWVWFAVVNSAGISYVRNLYRRASQIAAAAASPYDPEAEIALRFGTLQVGQVIHFKAAAVSEVSGQISSFIFGKGTVVSTV